LKILVKITYRKADLIIANSKKVAKDVGFFSKCKTTSVYPGSFNKFKKKVRYNNKSPKQIIWIGRLAKEKGIDILLESFNKINKKKYILKIIGDGPLRKKFESKINFYGLRNNIKLLGFQKKIFHYLKKSDLLINTSFFEGFPNVVIEALSQSVPVICSKSNGGINEILANGKYGDLFNMSSKNNLHIKVNNFLKNPSRLRKMALSSKNHLYKFEKKKSANIYEKIFDNL
jgi:glycosyltransferase involved in cell wall biosynthesis